MNYWMAAASPDSQGRYPDHLSQQQTTAALTCSGCGGRYIYRPVPPSGIEAEGRFIMWCSAPCHDGKRFAWFAGFELRYITDDEVSW